MIVTRTWDIWNDLQKNTTKLIFDFEFDFSWEMNRILTQHMHDVQALHLLLSNKIQEKNCQQKITR